VNHQESMTNVQKKKSLGEVIEQESFCESFTLVFIEFFSTCCSASFIGDSAINYWCSTQMNFGNKTHHWKNQLTKQQGWEAVTFRGLGKEE